MSTDEIILVVGATGYTGRLVVENLTKHSNRSFKLQLGGRSASKLNALVSELGLKGVETVVVDTLKEDQVNKAVQGASVVIACAGPFHRCGTLVLAACARYGKHYTDITGEPWWIEEMIKKYDYLAFKSGATIVPSGAFDSVPSDLLAFVGVQKLKEVAGLDVKVGKSITGHAVQGGVSGGTWTTLTSAFDEVPSSVIAKAIEPFTLSPVKGTSTGGRKLFFSFPKELGLRTHGSLFFMAFTNISIVQRTWGLYESGQYSDKPTTELKYGDSFEYEEFMVLPGSKILSYFFSIFLLWGLLLLYTFPPARWLAHRWGPKAGSGPSEEVRKNGRYRGTNITSSIPSPSSPVTRYVKSTFKGTNDPGYGLGAVMVSEIALALLPSARSKLTPIGQKGGVLTPMSALGFTLVERLNATDRITIESEEIVPSRTRKTQ
ncbi:Saccharopine dehydrogenase-domain-containing protein [Cantharellus anzutake]|uniref:Saccharopine dehydrogenase-domain-containing protein n=1 Tax=Cantharellus anzutake TaxID=1750568 RepID=UPI001905C2F2|nr:Saccharopine dehydrogenase-domain-containing protein [Cantharellus anzutake]KAF8342697.1 Saccharopine dehydrogenase-domain-containing protein [Cantharellus anzutake]